MNSILKSIIEYFKGFLRHCKRLIVTHEIKSGTIGAYVNALERMFENYGKRLTMGKKASKKYMDLYSYLIKEFELEDFLLAIYMEEI